MSSRVPAEQVIKQIQQEFPGASFIALGQTVFWDEPVKASWRILLDRHYPDAQLIAGVHDTDYFAKSTALIQSDSSYVVLPHDDGATRGLWSAAGELSALFGSEDLPTRALFESYGSPFDTLAHEYPTGKARFYAEKTVAWGWTGIVGTKSSAIIAADVPLNDYLPTLIDQLKSGFDLSINCLDSSSQDSALKLAERIIGWISECRRLETCTTLSDLYEALLPRFYQLLIGDSPINFSTTTSTKLFRFNSQTCNRPLFTILNHFLNPETSEICKQAYNRAVAGGGMYGLESFGEGALPFDLVVPKIGRGTLHLNHGDILIDLPGNSLEIRGKYITTSTQLAAELERLLGAEVALVGKAVSLIDMIAAEHIILFHETASGYTDRTASMNELIRKSGIKLDLKPIVRIAYSTWDALSKTPDSIVFRLPEHIADAFGRSTITANSFGARWRRVVANQRETLKTISELRSTRDLLTYLDQSGDDHNCWTCLQQDYNKALERLNETARDRQPLKSNILALKQKRLEMREARLSMQSQKGAHFRQVVKPLIDKRAQGDIAENTEALEEFERKWEEIIGYREKTFDSELNLLDTEIKNLNRKMKQFRAELRLQERDQEISDLRNRVKQIRIDSEFARLEHIRTAAVTSQSLPHTNARPTAWWFPLVDSTGSWFNALVDGTEAYLERV